MQQLNGGKYCFLVFICKINVYVSQILSKTKVYKHKNLISDVYFMHSEVQ